MKFKIIGVTLIALATIFTVFPLITHEIRGGCSGPDIEVRRRVGSIIYDLIQTGGKPKIEYPKQIVDDAQSGCILGYEQGTIPMDLFLLGAISLLVSYKSKLKKV